MIIEASSLCLCHDAVERPGQKVDACDDVAQALHAAYKLHNEHNGTRVQRVLQLLQRVVPAQGVRHKSAIEGARDATGIRKRKCCLTYAAPRSRRI